MKSWKIIPEDSNIARFVDCYWFLEKEHGDDIYNFPRLNPDPAAHLIIANAQQKFQYVADEVIQEGVGNHLIYPHSQTFVIDHSQPFQIVGIKFKIGALYSLAVGSVQPQLNEVVKVDFNKLIQSESFSAIDFLAIAKRLSHKACAILNERLVSLVSNSQEDKHSELVRSILPLIENVPISELGETLHCSQRRIERSFTRVTGMTLKQCISMIRLETILNYVYRLSDDQYDWAEIAARFNFSDQPHLINYFKSKIGVTPGDYIKQRNLTIDVYGHFE